MPAGGIDSADGSAKVNNMEGTNMSERRYGIEEICRAMDTTEREERYDKLVQRAAGLSYGITCVDCGNWETLCLCFDDDGSVLEARINYIRNGGGEGDFPPGRSCTRVAR